MWLVEGYQDIGLTSNLQAPVSSWPTFSGKEYHRRNDTTARRKDLPLRYRYGFHMPRTNARDNYYIKLEEERAAQKSE